MKWNGQEDEIAQAERAEMLPLYLTDPEAFFLRLFARCAPKPQEPLPWDEMDNEGDSE